jgi:hypothetical protein
MRRAKTTLAGMTCMSKKFENEDLEWVRAALLATPIDGPLKSMCSNLRTVPM